MPKQLNLDDYITNYKRLIERELNNCLQRLDIPKSLNDSMLYSLLAGGKRLRPILLIASYEAYGDNLDKTMSTALALEMIHTYSLIHDDLPAMDDDNYRRGELTNHKQFDEATAILAGDALLTYSFELVTNDDHLTNEEKVHIVKSLANASGPEGMVAGQILDLEAENKVVTLQQLENIHNKKTGRLLQFAVTTGAFLGQATKEQQNHLQTFAYYLGLIFQVQDDILDVTGNPEKLGKPVGSDLENEKSTYPNLLGLDGAIEQKIKYIQLAKDALILAQAEDSFMMDLTYHFSERDH